MLLHSNDKLTTLPESGHGFQRIRVNGANTPDEIPDGDYMVFNAELFIPIGSPLLNQPQKDYNAFIVHCSPHIKNVVGNVSLI
jgi:hypothetical protein